MKLDKFTLFLVTSVFSFLLAIHWIFFYRFEKMVGHLLIHAPSLLTRHSLDFNQMQNVFGFVRQDMNEFYPTLWQFTMGNPRFYPLFLAVIFFAAGIIFAILARRVHRA